MIRKRILVIAAALAMSAGVLFGTGTAKANTDTEWYLNHAPGWCATYNDTEYGAIVLGECADAGTQQFYLQTVSGNIFEITDGGSLCVTYNYPSGEPDGEPFILGNCAAAKTQQFQHEENSLGDWYYIMPWRTDNNGKEIAVDDKNYVLEPYNPIIASWFCTTCGSEEWSELFSA